MAEYKLSPVQWRKREIFKHLSAYYQNIITNEFEWDGLDNYTDSLTSEIMEKWLYENATSLIFKDKDFGLMNLPYNIAGGLNVYYKPTRMTAVGLNYTKTYDLTNSVIIRDNELEIPLKRLVDYYCWKLADIEVTMDLHRNAHKTPYIIEGDDKTLLSAKNIFKQIEASEPVIYRKKDSEIGIEVQNPNVAYINDKLNDEYNSYVAKILTLAGIDNYTEDKAERVQSAEVDSNKEYIVRSFEARLEQRMKACDRIKTVLGIDLTIDFKKYNINDDPNKLDEGGKENE